MAAEAPSPPRAAPPSRQQVSPASPSSTNATMRKSASAPSGGNAWKQEFQAKLHSKMKAVMRESTGPSFEERIQVAAERKRKDALSTEREQKKVLEDAVRRARERPMACPFRTKEETPESIESRTVRGLKDLRERNKEYAKHGEELKQRMAAREPLFKVSEVNAAFEEIKRKQAERRRQLQKEEREQWAHLRTLQESVFARPLMLEDGGHKTKHERKPTEERLVPSFERPSWLDKKIKSAMTNKEFIDSQWGGEVNSIRERANNRPKLWEISYPPKKIPEKPPPPRQRVPLDEALEKVVAQPWFKKCDWARQVQEIRQKQDDRPKLHEISYPPKK